MAVPLLAFLLRIRWAYAASFGLYALGLVAVQRLLLPPAAVARIEAERGGRLALLGGQALGLLGGLGCLALAFWLRGHPAASLLGRQ